MANVSAKGLVDEIRGLHSAFSRDKVTPAIARQFLVRCLNRVVGQVVEFNSDIVALEGEISEEKRNAVLNDAENPRNRISVPSFTTVVDSIRINRAAGGGEQKIYIVALHTQYPEPFVGQITFPATVLRDSHFELTDMRRVGKTAHGWGDYTGVIRYDYVPYVGPITESDAGVHIPSGLRSAIVLATGIEFAKRLDMADHAGSLMKEYEMELVRIRTQATRS